MASATSAADQALQHVSASTLQRYEAADDLSSTVSSSVVAVPFVYGTIAEVLSAEERAKLKDLQHTYKWRVYVRSTDDRNLDYAVRCVVFQLHSSFEQPLRGMWAIDNQHFFRYSLACTSYMPCIMMLTFVFCRGV